MTEQQFNNLKIGNEVIIYSQRLIITHINKKEGLVSACPESILIASSPDFKLIWYRYENCELVVKDELVDYLAEMSGVVRPYEDSAKKIRSIVRKEVIDGLKFPNPEHFNYRQTISRFDWFVEEIKQLNS